jgi:NAD(P)-dependent dehydrogenase (short-subunit alcohol dehydrogenase family)
VPNLGERYERFSKKKSPEGDMTQAFLILGGAGGIGAALARELRRMGHLPILAGRSRGPLEVLGAELDAPYHIVDATDIAAVEALVRQVASTTDALRGLAVCVGAIFLKPASRTSADDWHRLVAQNLTAAFAATRAAQLHLPRDSSVVFVSSAAARIGLANHEAVAATKAGIEGLVRAAAASSARKGIRFNAVAPGLVKTPLAGALATDPKLAEASARMHPLGRLGEPDDIARAMAFLLDPAQSWLTGQVLGVDGGLADLKLPG